MANKNRYYGLATREEKQDVSRKDNAARIYPEGPLSYSAVVTAIRNYKKDHPNFDNLSAQAAASEIAKELRKEGRYDNVSAEGVRISGEGYSIALTKGRGTDGMITASKASERIKSDKKE